MSGAPVLDYAALVNLAQSVNFPDPYLAAAVAMAESGGHPEAMGDAEFGGSVGLWQINLPAHPEYDAASLKDPATNARAAYAISRGGSDWNPWTTYRTGAFEKYYAPPGKGWGGWVGPMVVLAVGLGLLGQAVGWWDVVPPAVVSYARRAW